MEISEDRYSELLNWLNEVLEKELDDVVFLELNKDVHINHEITLNENIPLPIKSDYLIKGIESDKFSENIPLYDLVDSMVYLIGCNNHFKYNNKYIEIIKKLTKEIDAFLLNKASEFTKNKEYLNSLIYLRALEEISDKHHDVIRYNIAYTLKQISTEKGAESGSKSQSQYGKMYYELSYYEFLKLSEDFPEYDKVHYELGFYYLEKEDYESAKDELEKAYRFNEDGDLKKSISDLLSNVNDIIAFEKGKSYVIEGKAEEGLKILIPLTQRYKDFNEASYYTALGYRKLGNYAKTKLILEELIKKGESSPEIDNELGLCYFYDGEYKKAAESFEKALKMKDSDVGYMCNLGFTYYQLGLVDKAIHYIKKAYELNPEDEITKKSWSWIQNLK